MIAWLRDVIEGDKALAMYAITSEPKDISPVWEEMTSGVLTTGPGEDGDHWDGVWTVSDSRLTRHIAVHDPRDTIARCEAELAILDQHIELGVDKECSRCVVWDTDDEGELCATPLDYPCDTVRRLASGYRYRDGWKDEWAA